jgi:hypothetical protein
MLSVYHRRGPQNMRQFEVVRHANLQVRVQLSWGWGFRVDGLGLKVWGLGFRLQGSGFRA